MGELIEIKRELEKKDANRGQQNGQTGQSTNPSPTSTQIFQPQGTNKGQQTARTNQSELSYASMTGLPVIGLHVEPHQGNR